MSLNQTVTIKHQGRNVTGRVTFILPRSGRLPGVSFVLTTKQGREYGCTRRDDGKMWINF